MLKIRSRTPLPGGEEAQYRGIAFDGCSFFLTHKCRPKIYKLDTAMKIESCIDTNRTYTCLCFDPTENCFWGAVDKCYSVLFKLNSCFEEIDRLIIRLTNGGAGIITGISYNCANDSLIIGIGDELISINKNEHCREGTLKRIPSTFIMGVTCVSPYVIYSSFKNNKQTITIFSTDGCSEYVTDVPRDFSVESMIFAPCENSDDYHLRLLGLKHGSQPFLLTVETEDGVLESPHLCNNLSKTDCSSRSTEKCSNHHFWEDDDHDNAKDDYCCNIIDELKERLCDGSRREKCCKKDCRDECCHRKCCEQDCEDDCCRKYCRCKDDCCHCCPPSITQECSDILESIALQEAALAHILNAEGEKLQKAIAQSCSCCDLLKVNESVKKTIVQVTHLEQVLFNKLEVVKECIKSCKCK